MATPRGAEHRDLEQRLRDLERGLQALTGAALRRRQLSVEQGDFVVSGGGAIYVRGDDTLAVLAPDSVNIATLAGDGWWVPPNMTLQPDGFVAGNADGDIVVFRIDENGAAVLTSSTDTAWLPDNVFAGKVHGTGNLETDAELIVVKEAHFLQNVAMPGIPTTGAGANINWNPTNGRLRVVTSTERDKSDIDPAEVDVDACERLQEVIYTRRETGDRELGYIAERAHELGLHAFVVYDDDGEPWSFDYVMFAAVAHQAMLRRERERRAELEATVAEQAELLQALSERLDRLEGRATA